MRKGGSQGDLREISSKIKALTEGEESATLPMGEPSLEATEMLPPSPGNAKRAGPDEVAAYTKTSSARTFHLSPAVVPATLEL